MRALILAAGAALTLSACGGGNEAGTEQNNSMAVETLEVDNVILNDPAMMNGTTDMNAMDPNMMDPNMMGTNEVGTDMTTNETGTNTTGM